MKHRIELVWWDDSPGAHAFISTQSDALDTSKQLVTALKIIPDVKRILIIRTIDKEQDLIIHWERKAMVWQKV